MKSRFDEAILDSGNVMRQGYGILLDNLGKAVACVTMCVAILLTFTTVGFCDFGTRSFTTEMTLMLLASYVMYFALEDTGEKRGEETEEYRAAQKRFQTARASVKGEEIPALRDFLIEYGKEEARYRRTCLLCAAGFSYGEYERWLTDGKAKGKARRAFRRAEKVKPIFLPPKRLLSSDVGNGRSELHDPAAKHFLHLAVRLIPSTLASVLTVSVIVTAKTGMTASAVIGGILKLSPLPIVGFRGYAAGYDYVKQTAASWLETKADILTAFCKQREKTA